MKKFSWIYQGRDLLKQYKCPLSESAGLTGYLKKALIWFSDLLLLKFLNSPVILFHFSLELKNIPHYAAPLITSYLNQCTDKEQPNTVRLHSVTVLSANRYRPTFIL